MGGPSGPSKSKEKDLQKSSGESQPELRYLAIGRVTRAHGVRGEISVAVLTDFPERFEITEWVYLGDEFEAMPYRLEKYRWHKKNVLLTLGGVTDRTQAEQLKGQLVQVPIEGLCHLSCGPRDAGFVQEAPYMAAHQCVQLAPFGLVGFVTTLSSAQATRS